MTAKFLRRTWKRYSKLGRKRKKKQVWRRPTGRDNKMREKRKGYPIVVSIGYRTEKNMRGKIDNKEVVVIKNIIELEKLNKGKTIIIGSIGKKKKLEIAKKAKEKNIPIYNLNVNKFIKELTKTK